MRGDHNEWRWVSDRVNRLPKWARDYIHEVQTFIGAPEVEELMFLRDERRMLIKLIAEQKREMNRLRNRLAKLSSKASR
jgi:DNA-binding ferritin-like protein (Dps family)